MSDDETAEVPSSGAGLEEVDKSLPLEDIEKKATVDPAPAMALPKAKKRPAVSWALNL